MPYHVFFDLSVGLAKTMHVPKGTRQRCLDHVKHVEATLGLETTKYLDNPPHWNSFKMPEAFAKVDDKTLCKTVQDHNQFVRWFYGVLADASEKRATKDTEPLTKKQAAEFWHGRDRMEMAYDVMRGRDSEGVCRVTTTTWRRPTTAAIHGASGAGLWRPTM